MRWHRGVQSRSQRGERPARRLTGVLLKFLPKAGFVVIDAHERPFATDQQLFSRGLARTDVVGAPLESWVFSLVDAVWLGDNRIEEIRRAHAA